MLGCTPNVLVSDVIIPPDESFLVSTPMKIKGIESESHALLCLWYSLCRSRVIDDTRLYAYFIGTCIFYRVILGTPLLCSQCVGRPKEMGGGFFVGFVISVGEKMERSKCVLTVRVISVFLGSLLHRNLQVKKVIFLCTSLHCNHTGL